MGDSTQSNATSLRNPNLAKWDILFDKKIVEWISFKPQLGLSVYPCYACRHMFASKNSFLDHVNRRALLLHYTCVICVKELTFYNPCSFLLHTRQHFTLLGGQIHLENLKVSVLPFGLGGFLPDPTVPLLYNVEEDEVGEISTINTRFYSPLQETMGQPVISLIPNEVLFLFMVEPNGSLSSLVLKQISSTIPKCKFIAMDNNRLNPIPSGVDVYGRELQNISNINNDEARIGIKREPEDAEENSNQTQYACPIITKIETVREKENESILKCPECDLLLVDKSMTKHFLETNRPFRENLKCDVCTYIAPTKCSLKAHERIHQVQAPYICPECGQNFDSANLLRIHSEDTCFHLAKQVRLKCPGKHCGKVFAQILTFTTHFALHMQRLSKCPHCDDMFATDKAYFEHRVKHNSKNLPIPIYDCSVCKETFNDGSSSDHIYDHATNKRQCVYVYTCKRCRSYFRSTTTYATHLLRCSKLGTRTQPQAFNKSSPTPEKPKKKQSLYILGTCYTCKTQIKAQVPKVDNMPENCPNCSRPLKSKNENVLFVTENDNSIKCVLCDEVLDPQKLDSHFIPGNCKYLRPAIPLERVDTKYSEIDSTPKPETNFKKKRRKPWSTPHASKQKRLSVTLDPELAVNLDVVEPAAFDGTYYCKLCSFENNNRSKFHQHIIQHRNVSTAYQCMECGECFVVKPSLEKHLVYYHQVADIESYFSENDCFDKQAVKELEDVMHLAPGETKEVAENQCRVCLQQFNDSNELGQHFRTHGMAFILKNSK